MDLVTEVTYRPVLNLVRAFFCASLESFEDVCPLICNQPVRPQINNYALCLNVKSKLKGATFATKNEPAATCWHSRKTNVSLLPENTTGYKNVRVLP